MVHAKQIHKIMMYKPECQVRNLLLKLSPGRSLSSDGHEYSDLQIIHLI